jgi:predicted Fe-S protein YdhL (DUF1289 family)
MIRASTNSDEISSEIINWARMPTSSSRYFMRAHIIPRNERRIPPYTPTRPDFTYNIKSPCTHLSNMTNRTTMNPGVHN